MNHVYLLSPWCERQYLAAQNSLLYLKYYMADHGYAAKVIDCSHYDQDYVDVVNLIRKNENPVVGITAYTRERFHAYRLIKRLKREIPGSLIVVGGRHFGFLAEETLAVLPDVDIVVRGEGEITMKEICDVVYKQKPLQDVPGISFRSNGSIQHNEDRPFEEDLDKFRCFEVSDEEELCHHSVTGKSKIDAKREYFSVMATRGCPNRCIYCSQTATKVRFRSIASIIKEIEDRIRITGIRNVTFADSSLTINRHFVEGLCREIIARNLNIRFNCYSRVNINPDLLKIMKSAGLKSVEIGLESGSPRILKSIRKNIRIEEFRKFCEMACGLGIKIYVFCMVSLPDETIEDADRTIGLIKDLSRYIYYVGVQTTRILPDAALYEVAKERGLLPPGFDWFKPYDIPEDLRPIAKDPFYSSIPIYLEHLSVKEIQTKLEEFRRVIDSRLSNFDALKKAVGYNLSKEGLKRLNIGNVGRKSIRLLSMSYHSYMNRKKELNYDEGEGRKEQKSGSSAVD